MKNLISILIIGSLIIGSLSTVALHNDNNIIEKTEKYWISNPLMYDNENYVTVEIP